MTAHLSPQKQLQNASGQRIDKWLWFARLIKTRTLGTRLVTTGKIRLNREKIDKPSQNVKIGDVITARIGRRILVLKVLDTGKRRGPSSEAVKLYEDLTPPEDALKKAIGPGQKMPRGGAALPGKVAARTQGSGRPTKRERRQLDRLRGDSG